MDNFPGWLAVRAWKLREPLTSQWKLTEPDQRDRVLAFWIRASESDKWTFEQLQDLLNSVMDANEIPDALQAWANEVTARRRKIPTRRGPKSDPRGDFKTMVDAILRKALRGTSLRRAYHEIAKKANRSPEAVESAVRRGKQWPPSSV